MSEIDKLVNRAYPDELRKVTPIAVDEDAILARTLEKLGLEKEEQPGKEKKPRHEARHTERKPVRLVEVPLERSKGGWVKWAGWAVAACVAMVFAVTWWPKMEGPRAGAPVAPGAYFEEIGEDIDGDGNVAARAAGERQAGLDAGIVSKTVDDIANGKGISVNLGIEAVNEARFGQDIRGGILVTQVNPTKNGFTLYISFQENTLEEIEQHNFEVYGESGAGYYIAKRSNMEGLVIVEFSRGKEESGEDSAVLLVYRMDGTGAGDETDGNVTAAFHLYPSERKAIPFTQEDYDALYSTDGGVDLTTAAANG